MHLRAAEYIYRVKAYKIMIKLQLLELFYCSLTGLGFGTWYVLELYTNKIAIIYGIFFK